MDTYQQEEKEPPLTRGQGKKAECIRAFVWFNSLNSVFFLFKLYIIIVSLCVWVRGTARKPALPRSYQCY